MTTACRFAILMFLMPPTFARGQVFQDASVPETVDGIDIKIGEMADTQEIVAWKYLNALSVLLPGKTLGKKLLINFSEIRSCP